LNSERLNHSAKSALVVAVLPSFPYVCEEGRENMRAEERIKNRIKWKKRKKRRRGVSARRKRDENKRKKRRRGRKERKNADRMIYRKELEKEGARKNTFFPPGTTPTAPVPYFLLLLFLVRFESFL
jgi:hypothetical protein